MSEESDAPRGVEMFVELTIGIKTASWVKPGQLPTLANLLSMVDLSTVGFGDTAHLHGHLADGTCFDATILVDMTRYRDGVVEEAMEADVDSQVSEAIPPFELSEEFTSKAVH